MAVTPLLIFNLLSTWFYFGLSLFYGFYKYMLRRITGKCEIARICDSSSTNTNYVFHLETSFKNSKDVKIRQAALCNSDEAIESFIKHVVKIKSLKPHEASMIQQPLSIAIRQISAYSILLNEMETLTSTPYDSQDLALESELYEIWNHLMPNENLQGRFTDQWTQIGFQGKDPGTDFRGMGLFGLRNILYFARRHSSVARKNLSAANHPTRGYSYAIVAIDITQLVYSEMLQDLWKPLFCCPKRDDVLPNKSAASLDNLHEIFCSVFNEFHEFWIMEERNIMEYGKYREQFKTLLEGKYRVEPFCLQVLDSS